MVVKKILDALSLKAVRHRLDKRKLQEELDLHRLYLITAYHHHLLGKQDATATLSEIEEDVASILDAEAQKLGPDGLRSQVSSFLSHQLYNLTKTMHKALEGANDDGPAKALAQLWRQQEEEEHSKGPSTPRLQNGGTSGGLGLAFAAQKSTATTTTTKKKSNQENFKTRLTLNQVSDAFFSLSNFTLHVSPSSITHSAAGQGLFLRGTASVGQIVALYPGVAYSPLFHRNIPGYPLVARSNPFLLSRFDGVVLDAKPWRKGAAEEVDKSSGGGDRNESAAAEIFGAQNMAEEALLSRLERRNPVALAHYANHPPAGTPPNVMVAAVDWNNEKTFIENPKTTTKAAAEADSKGSAPGEDEAGELRAYIPVIDFCIPNSSGGAAASSIKNRTPEEEEETSRGTRGVDENINNILPKKSDLAPCVALVALRDIDNEELFLNYRLNPNAPGGLPDWYSSVDLEEDARRWS